MSMPTVFISYSHHDEPWKDRLVKHLGIAEKQGLLQTWNDRNLLGGDDWFTAIINAIERGSVAVLLVSYNSLTSDFILNEEVPRMLTQHKLQAARFYPIVVEDCDWEAVEWLRQFNLRPRDGRPVGINKKEERTEEQINRDLKDIAKEIRLAPPLHVASSVPEPLADECPYLGLEAFTEDKRHLFFGRDNFIEAIWQKLQARQFVAVVGPSGSGKSSVVQAGVFPRLDSEWHKLVFQPGDDPFLNLADKFIEMRGTRYRHFSERSKAVETLAQQIRGNHSIAATVTETLAALPQPSHLLLVADQFEELFTLTPTADRQPFAEAFLATSRLAELKVLVTLRADFFGQAISLTPELSQLIQDGVVTHRPLQRADWEAAILKPAKTVGLHVDPALVALILEEVEAQPNSLPLLEYALKELWQHRAQGRIGLAEYEIIGKLTGAINQRADAVLARLPAEQQLLALRAITRLVRVAGEEGEADTRLRRPLSELLEAERAVLQPFVIARLLVINREECVGAETIEVAHEALIRRWENLQKALGSDREFLIWRQRLDFRRKAWEQKGHDDKWLLYGGERDDAQRWLNERRSELTAAEIRFITWDDRPEFQVERILAEIPSLLRSSNEETRKSWFATLVFCREKEKALSIAREIEIVHYRVKALISIVEALATAGMATEARAVATEALAVAREFEVAGYRLSSIAEALATAGMAPESLAAARKIKYADERVKTLSSIAATLINAGLVTEAREAATEALDAIRGFTFAFEVANALTSIAETLVKAGTATEALAIAREIKDADYLPGTLSSIATVLAKAGMVTEASEVAMEALATVDEIKNEDYLPGALSSIATVLAKAGMVAEARMAATAALAAARKIMDMDEYRVYELCSIAETLATAGMATEARAVATEALAVAREIESADDSAFNFSSVAVTLGELGMATEALAAASEIEITDEDSRAETLRSIAKALVEAGMATEALAAVRKIAYAYFREEALLIIAEALATAGMATEALATTREIRDEGSRAKALCSIAEALMKAGLVTEALTTACEIESAVFRTKALCSIAEALMKAGLVTEMREVVMETLAIAREIEVVNDRAKTLSSIAEALMKVGLVTEMREVAMEALDAAREIKDAHSHSRPQILSSIAELLMRNGLATEALIVAREFEYAYSRAKALMEVANLCLEQGQADEAWNLFEEAQDAINKVSDDEKRSEVIRHLAIVLARLHIYRAARDFAEKCSSSSDRLAAYTAILRECHIERDPSLSSPKIGRCGP